MGLFKSLKKAFKKITRGIKKVIKKTVKGIKKVVKKIASSKILKAIAIAAAIYITGGAAIKAFSGGTATGFAGSWMTGATNLAAGTGFTATGAAAGTWTAAAQTAAGFLATPFAAAGRALGTAAAAVTDFTGLTTEASRHGVESIAYDPVNQGFVNTQTGEIVAEKTLTDTGLSQAYVDTMKTTGSYLDKAGNIVRAGEAVVAPSANAMDTWAKRNPMTAAFVTGAGTTAMSVASGYALHQLTAPEETGSMAGLRTEKASDFDPIRVYAAERGIADSDIYKYFTFGNTPEAGNMPLFQQQTIGAPA